MRVVDLLKFEFEKQTLCAGQRLGPVDGLLYEHELTEDVVDDPQVRLRVVLVWLHYLGTGSLHGGKTGQWHNAFAVVLLGTLLEKYFAQDILLFVVGIVVLHVVVMGLVKHAVRVVVAVRVLVPDPLYLIQLRLRVLVQVWT